MGQKDISENIFELIDNIKRDIISTRNTVLRNANQELISMYLRIGKCISENASYGSNFINLLSNHLRVEFPDAIGYSPRNLSRMRRFYEEYHDISNLPTALANLPWSFNCLLLDKIKPLDKRIWYAEKCLENGWSHVVLDHQIDLLLYERQADNNRKLNNFSDNLSANQGELAKEILKDPYVFELVGLKDKIVEKDIEKALLEKIKNVLMELGKGFSFVGSQYKVSTGNKDYYIDLIFYHLELHCYVVVELKNTDFDPAYIGQLQFYVTAVDETIKKEMDNPSIGLLLCKEKDKLSVEWALKPVNAPIGVASYEIKKYLPSADELKKILKE